MLIRAINNLDEKAPITYLTQTEAAAGTTLNVKNTNGFPAQWAVQIGKTGEERTEIKLMANATPSGGTIDLAAALDYDHPENTPVYAIRWNQLVFKRSTSGTAGTATSISNGTVNITPDRAELIDGHRKSFTQFDDTSGATTYAYKVAFRNSALNEESTNSDWLTPAGFSFYSLARIRQRVRNRTYMSNLGDTLIDEWINEWLESMNNAAIQVNKDYSMGTVDVSVGTSGLGTITSEDFKEIRRLWWTTDGSNFYRGIKMDLVDFLPDETFHNTQPHYYMEGDTVIGIKPSGQAGTARLHYYKRNSLLSSDADELPPVMRSYTNSFVSYAKAQEAYRDNKSDMGDRFLVAAQDSLDKFTREIAPRNKGGPVTIDLVEAIDGEDNASLWFI